MSQHSTHNKLNFGQAENIAAAGMLPLGIKHEEPNKYF